MLLCHTPEIPEESSGIPDVQSLLDKRRELGLEIHDPIHDKVL
jgi:hypothetical protein